MSFLAGFQERQDYRIIHMTYDIIIVIIVKICYYLYRLRSETMDWKEHIYNY